MGSQMAEAPIMRDPVPEWERRILCTVEHPRAAQISEKTQSTRDPAVTEFRWFADQRPAAWIT
jgi:precorrin isomerase